MIKRFEKDAFYRHKCTLDMDLEVIKTVYYGKDKIILKVNMVNRKHSRAYAFHEKVTIKRKDLWLWSKVIPVSLD